MRSIASEDPISKNKEKEKGRPDLSSGQRPGGCFTPELPPFVL
jgi:hypothetical protein